ncbi:hypothetical protein WISP_113563 [Willisornis vidua]|uniref:Uncharacterized protein n=1 Tax=Willisornis vidua TaxID=1566151 RepID=A0ABQ9D0M0_9PASS|nr:hypothetical protein WISP_113563 [Willisornis vidua]
MLAQDSFPGFRILTHSGIEVTKDYDLIICRNLLGEAVQVLRELANVVAKPLSIIFEESSQSNKVPGDWKSKTLLPFVKSGQKKIQKTTKGEPNLCAWKVHEADPASPKFQVLHLGQGSPRQEYRLGEVIESSPADEDLGALVNEELDTSQQCVLAEPETQPYPELYQKQCGQQAEGGDSPPLTCPCGTHMECCIQFWGPQHRTDRPIEVGPEQATKMIRGPKHLSCEEGLRDLELFSLEKKILRGGLRASFEYLKRGLQKGRRVTSYMGR